MTEPDPLPSAKALVAPGVPILYEDESLLAVSKPEGLLSHPNPGPDGKRAVFLGRFDPEARTFRKDGLCLWLVHRLDYDTSGVLLAAKTEAAYLALVEAFEDRRVMKVYQAMLTRAPRPESGRWVDRLEKVTGEGYVGSRVVKDGDKNAALRYRTLRRVGKPGYALVELVLETGKTHQIRVQAAARGTPVLGDRTHGHFQANKEAKNLLGLRRLFLHALRVELDHPGTGKRLVLEAPLAPALAEILGPRKPPAGQPGAARSKTPSRTPRRRS